MPKVNKNLIKIGDATLQSQGTPIQFLQRYKKWTDECSRLTGASIGVKGSTSLLNAVKNHAIPVRPNSKNDGTTGSFLSLKNIDRIALKRKNGIFYEDDIDALEVLEGDIKDLEDHPTLNPQNIMFSIPSRYNKKTGSYPKGVKMVPVYGHYLDDYFKTKHGRKDGDKSWVNSQPDTATPPIYQALFGGTLVTEGLLTIIEDSIVELDEAEYQLVINSAKPAKYLQKIPSFRSALSSALKSSRDGDSVSVSKVMSKLNGKFFDAKTDAKTQKLLSNYASIKEGIAGDFTSFSLNLTTAKTKKIITDYYNTTSTATKRRTFTKSWKNILVV